jgi:hypothetical protein
MWIFRIICLFRGHAFVDITTAEHPYQYCLHCGKEDHKAVYARVQVNTEDWK